MKWSKHSDNKSSKQTKTISTVPEHRILITINQLPIFLIDFDLFDFFDYIDYIDFELIDFCIDFFFDLAY